jgi:hydroxymethylpyrimidine pyrophosphatase-like HAD family hydrolase
VIAGLTTTVNLGKADIYPRASGKASAAVYVAEQFGVAMQDCAFFGDDDNDIDLSKVVGKAYLPSISAVRPDRL